MTRRSMTVATAVLALTAALVAAAIGISQASLTINANGSMPLCLQRARTVLEQAGLQVLNTSAFSIGAEPQDGRVLVTAYCLPSDNLVVLTAAGQHNRRHAALAGTAAHGDVAVDTTAEAGSVDRAHRRVVQAASALLAARVASVAGCA